MRFFLLIFIAVFYSRLVSAQSFIHAELKGTPLNTNGWTLKGAAVLGNVTGTGNSELIICKNEFSKIGSVFYNTPINLCACSKWSVEFDFRIFDGNQGDGFAFCFLEKLPTEFVGGGGLGIPASVNGLKVGFDTYPNCLSRYNDTIVPKIVIRWGAGYNECRAQPTVENNRGKLSFIRSNNYNRAKIVYNRGSVSVYINNKLWVTGFQELNFQGYFGFSASTGSHTDNHSIKNVSIYTDMPSRGEGKETTCVYVPGAFSPNGDGKNDVFKPLVFGIVKNFRFIIFNRFGQKVFETAQLETGWNGSSKGILMNNEVFIWTCSYQSGNGKLQTLKGTVVLVR